MTHFQGKVTRIDYKSNTYCLSIGGEDKSSKDVKGGKGSINLVMPKKIFCPAKVNDTMTAIFEKRITSTGTECVITEKPLVIVDTSLPNTVKLLSSLKDGGRYICDYKLANSLCKSLDMIDKKKGAYAMLCKLGYRLCVEGDESILEQHLSIVSPDKLTAILTRWHRKESPRRLWLLGLYGSEFGSSSDYHDLYERIIKNPYAVYSISEERAESICYIMGVKVTPIMLELGLLGRFLAKYKHTHIPLKLITKKFPTAMSYLTDQTREEYQLDTEGNRFYLRHLLQAEKSVAVFLLQKKSSSTKDEKEEKDEVKLETKLDEKQYFTLKEATKNKVSIITGGAGVGKTLLIGGLVEYIIKQGMGIPLVCAYTGKAVSRVQDSLGERTTASTIHKLIARSNALKRGGRYFIIIDEASMLSLQLFADLLRTMTENACDTTVILVGDINQLSPIESGWVMKQLSKILPVYQLDKCYRVKHAESNLYKTSQAISQKKEVEIESGGNLLHYMGDEEKVVALVKQALQNGITKEQVTVICPYRKECISLNKKIQSLYNDAALPFYPKDRVMMTKNNYVAGVMNGVEGEYVREKLSKGGLLNYIIRFGKEEVALDADEIKDVSLAYCLTTHKSQGSEWKCVIFYIPSDKRSSVYFLNREMLYTAITRARSLCIIVSSLSTVNAMANTKEMVVFDHLSTRCGGKEELPATEEDECSAEMEESMEDMFDDCW